MIETLHFEKLGFSYRQDNCLLDDVTFSFPLNKTIWLDGEAGCGKTVIFKLIMGLINPTQGDIYINGESVMGMSFANFQRYRLRMGYGFEMGGLLNNRTLRDNLMLPLLFHKMCSESEAQERAMEYLSIFGLQNDARSLPAMVSGSKRKCTTVARALIHHPEFLLLDDPTTGLSSNHMDALMKLLEGHRKKHGLRHVYFTTRRPYFVKATNASAIILYNQKLTVAESDILVETLPGTGT